MVGSFKFGPQNRLRKSSEFLTCKKQGQKLLSHHFICQYRKNEYDCSRLGLIVTKKTGSSVVRNRWKRLIKESFRFHLPIQNKNLDIVFVVKNSIQSSPPVSIHLEIKNLLDRAGRI